MPHTFSAPDEEFVTDRIDIKELRQTEIAPKLKKGDTTFEPLSVTRLGGILPWDIEQDQQLCGGTIVNTDDDMNVRMTIEGYCLLSQLADLLELRNSANEVQIVWSGSEETGITTVTFDQLRFDIRDGEAVVEDSGESRRICSFQLQSKEDTKQN